MASQAVLYRRLILGVLACYWLAIFTGTHISQRAVREIEIEVSDKLQHYVAYAGLAFLLASFRACLSPPTVKSFVWLFGLAAAYGAFDEISQIPVGRDAEFADWCADLIGVATGLTAFAVLWGIVHRLRGGTPSPSLAEAQASQERT